MCKLEGNNEEKKTRNRGKKGKGRCTVQDLGTAEGRAFLKEHEVTWLEGTKRMEMRKYEPEEL